MLNTPPRKTGRVLTPLGATGIRHATLLFACAFALACSEKQGVSEPKPTTAKAEVRAPLETMMRDERPARPEAEAYVAFELTNDSSAEGAHGEDDRYFVDELLDEETSDPHSIESNDGVEGTAELELSDARPGELQDLSALHPDHEVRKSSLEKLSDGSEPHALESFIAALEDNDLEVVELAIEQLKSIDDPSAIPALDSLAVSHTDEEIQQAASEAVEFLE